MACDSSKRASAPQTSHLCASSRITCRVRTAGISPGLPHGLGHGLDHLWLQGGGCIIVHVDFPAGQKTQACLTGKGDGTPTWLHGAGRQGVRAGAPLQKLLSRRPQQRGIRQGWTARGAAARVRPLPPRAPPLWRDLNPLAFYTSPVFRFSPVAPVNGGFEAGGVWAPPPPLSASLPPTRGRRAAPPLSLRFLAWNDLAPHPISLDSS